MGGTGMISSCVSRMAIERGWELFLLNRGQKVRFPAGETNPRGVRSLVADVHQPDELRAALRGHSFDVVVDWIAYKPADVERDLALFRGAVGQYIFISSASAYQKPPKHYLITESTPLVNPFWEYSCDKIACEELLMRAYREEGFPVTIVRPSLTYENRFPVVFGGGGCYTLADRIKKGRAIIVHGDGTSLWVVTHAEDFGRAFLGLVGSKAALGQEFHITSDEVLTWDQIHQTIGDALGVSPRIVHIPSDFIARVKPARNGPLFGDKAWSTVFDNCKIKAFVPGFQAIIPFWQGVRRTLAWFEADEGRKRIDEALNREMDEIIAAYGE
jgi:nucleoside-diphosphate-sugar epimerase